jgi:hypothetical protein
MKHYMVIPEDGGFYGDKTIIRNIDAIREGRESIRDIAHLDFELDTWSGDDIVAVALTMVVTDALAQSLIQAKITGIRFEEVTISTSSVFKRKMKRYTELANLPKFRWMIVDGKAEFDANGRLLSTSGDDLCSGTNVNPVTLTYPLPKIMPLPTHALIGSESFVRVLREHKISHCEITEVFQEK